MLGKQADVVGRMQEQRIIWIVCIVRMDTEGVEESITEWKPTAVRKIGIPTLRRQDVRGGSGINEESELQ